jgi:transposase
MIASGYSYRWLAAAGKPKVVVTTEIAREMVGFIWAIARIAQPALHG